MCAVAQNVLLQRVSVMTEIFNAMIKMYEDFSKDERKRVLSIIIDMENEEWKQQKGCDNDERRS